MIKRTSEIIAITTRAYNKFMLQTTTTTNANFLQRQTIQFVVAENWHKVIYNYVQLL